MIAKLIHWSIANRFLVLLLRTVMVTAWGVISLPARRSTRCPICRTCKSSSAPRIRAGAAHCRKSDHVSADDHDAVGAGREDRARLLVLR